MAPQPSKTDAAWSGSEAIPVKAHAAQIGTVEGLLRCDLTHEAGLFLRTGVAHTPGSFVPLRLTNEATQEQVSLMCRVLRQISEHPPSAPGQVGLELGFDRDNQDVVRRLASWIATPKPDAASAAATPSDAVDLSHALEPLDSPSGLVDLSAAVEPVRDPETPTSQNAEEQSSEELRAATEAARTRSKELLAEATTAQGEGRHQDAYALLEEVLEIYPVNAVELHTRLARLALGPLGDLAAARKHAASASALGPDHPSSISLRKEIAVATQKATLSDPREEEQEEEESGSLLPAPQTDTAARRRGLAVVGVLTMLLLGAVGWSVWRHAFPRGKAPKVVTSAAVNEIVGAKRILVHRNALFITVGDAWRKLRRQRKSQALIRLGDIARREHGVLRVVVSDEEPQLLGVFQDGKATVYQ